MDKLKLRQTIFGIVLGIAVGLLIDSILLLASSAWLIVFIIPVVIPVIAGAAGFGILGKGGYLRVSSWLSILLVIVIAWPLCLLGPIWWKEAELKSGVSRELPVYAGSQKISTNVVPIGGDGKPWIGVDFSVKANYLEVMDFYRRELPKKGWKIKHDNFMGLSDNKGYHDGWMITANKSGRDLSVSVWDEVNKDSVSQEHSTIIRVNYV